MKKFLNFLGLFLFLFMLFFGDVEAAEYKVGDLFAPKELATVKTDNFIYNNIYFDGKVVTFGEVKNLTDEKIPVSVSIGLFDASKKNIGIINYCSNEDYESDFSGLNLKKGQSTNFNVLVKNKYLKEENSQGNISYLGIIDDNIYCKVGGATNYIGKSMEEIKGQESLTVREVSGLDKLLEMVLAIATLNGIVFLVVSLVLYVLLGLLINNLHAKMYGNSTVLAFVPICNSYLLVKLSFGKMIAIGYLVVAVLFTMMGTIGTVLIAITNLVSLLIVIIKLVTKNYDLFIVNNVSLPKKISKKEKMQSESNVSRDDSLFFDNKNSLIDDDFSSSKGLSENNFSNSNSISMGGYNNRNNMIDGSFSEDRGIPDNNFNGSIGSSNDDLNKLFNNSMNNNSNSSINNNSNTLGGNNQSIQNDEDGNELSKFFK